VYGSNDDDDDDDDGDFIDGEELSERHKTIKHMPGFVKMGCSSVSDTNPLD